MTLAEEIFSPEQWRFIESIQRYRCLRRIKERVFDVMTDPDEWEDTSNDNLLLEVEYDTPFDGYSLLVFERNDRWNYVIKNDEDEPVSWGNSQCETEEEAIVECVERLFSGLIL